MQAISESVQSDWPKWKVAGSVPLRWRYWAGDYIVFNPLSGQTHFLDIVTGQVLRLIMSRSLSGSALRPHIAAFLEVDESDHQLVLLVEDILTKLDDLDLIVRDR